jgi:hypothetical protein
MPPKKGNSSKSKSKPASTAKAENGAATEHDEKTEDVKDTSDVKNQSVPDEKPSKKRKKTASDDEPQKAARRSGRGASKSKPSQEQLLKYMLSKEAEDLCRPQDETEDMGNRGNIRTYSSSVFSPYEELLCAVVLSRPISHRLGLRTIRTILNDPYNFTSAKATQNAGSEKQHQALWDARTQHKDKTATQIGQIADVVLEKFTSSGDKEGTQLQKVRDDNNEDIDSELNQLKDSINGLGKTGLEIFRRRVQWLWTEAYPYIDDRTSQSLHKLGLPDEAEELLQMLDKHWKQMSTQHLAGDDAASKKRRAFVTVLERATGCDLEGKVDDLVEAAAGA